MHSMFRVHFLLFCVRTKYPGCSVYIHWSLQYAPEEFLILKKQTHLPSINSTDIFHFLSDKKFQARDFRHNSHGIF